MQLRSTAFPRIRPRLLAVGVVAVLASCAADPNYPRLSSVPDRPENVPTPAERAALLEELSEDAALAANEPRIALPFGPDSATVESAGAASLRAFAAEARDAASIRVVAYAPEGEAALALTRGRAVAGILEGAGIDPARLAVETAVGVEDRADVFVVR